MQSEQTKEMDKVKEIWKKWNQTLTKGFKNQTDKIPNTIQKQHQSVTMFKTVKLKLPMKRWRDYSQQNKETKEQFIEKA